MQGQEYLNQISASNRPVKQSKMTNVLSSKFFIVGVIAVVALIVIIILGSILGGNKGGEKNNCYRLYLHLAATAEVIDDYQNDVKSSDLRASGASLKGVLNNTTKDLTDYLTAKYQFKEKEIDKDFIAEANTAKDGLESELFEAKINGNLDRIFAHKMAYEISLIATEETQIANSTSNDTLKELLTKSYGSLDSLYNNFNDFSETK